MARNPIVWPAAVLFVLILLASGIWVPPRGTGSSPLSGRESGPAHAVAVLDSVGAAGGPFGESTLGRTTSGLHDPSPPHAHPRAVSPSQGISGDWWNLTPTLVLGPSQRSGAAIAFAPTTSQVVLFGGNNRSTFLGDTWMFQQGSWTKGHPSLSPSPRTHAALVFDPPLGGCVLFGGRNLTGALNDTWLFSSGNWSRVATNGAPSARSSVGLAYDSIANRTFLFGGLNRTGAALGDTWSFDGKNWSALSLLSPPSPRFGTTFTPYPLLSGELLFGGAAGASGAGLNDTWLLSHGRWTNLSPPGSPPMRVDASAELVDAHSAVLLFGGLDPISLQYENDSWEFRGSSWAPLPSADQPTPRANSSLVWDGADGYLLLVGGDAHGAPLAENWVYALPLASVASSSTLETDVGHVVQFNATAHGGVPPYLFNWRSSTGLGSPISLNPAWSASFGSPAFVVVTVLASDRVGAAASMNLTLAVEPLPTVTLGTGAMATDVGLLTSFGAAYSGGVPPLTLLWKFGDGSAASGPNATHRYANPGSYTANATVHDALGANGTALLRVTVASLPGSPISASQAATQAGYPVVFSVAPVGGTGRISVVWEFGDGQGATGDSVSHRFSSAGLFVVQANLTDQVNGSTVALYTENVTTPPPSQRSNVGSELLLLVPVLLVAIVVAAVWGRSRRRARPERPSEPELEPGEVPPEESREPEELPGGGREDG